MHLQCVFLAVIASTSAKVCVLQQMLTMEHSYCDPPINCSVPHFIYADSDNDYDDSIDDLVLPPLEPGSPAFSHFQSVRAEEMPKSAKEVRSFAISRSAVDKLPTCEIVTCGDECRYRSYDASNNNLKHPTWGATDSPLLRLLPPNYSARNGVVGKSVNGTDLPNARYISTSIFPFANRSSPTHTLAGMQWGQLIAHDFALSPNNGGNCCTDVADYVDNCLAIKIPEDDPFYRQYNQTCLNMMRTKSIPGSFGCMEFPNQISSVTHYMDMSMMYGSNYTNAYDLRVCEGGLLQMYRSPDGRYFPPLSHNSEFDCSSTSPNITCFRSGDTRINQNTQLTCMMVVLIREHNRIATEFATLNPHWDDERLYQETRAVMIAIFQHITYKNYLPPIIGMKYLKIYNLEPLDEGYSFAYNDSVNAATINSFMTGAFRSFHSAIQGRLWKVNSVKRCPFAALNISDYMLRPGIVIKDNNLDELLLGLTVEPAAFVDRFFTTQMTEMMFHGGNPYGEDLESFDIQRGRDHGISSYNVMRELCHRPRAKTFDDLKYDLGDLHVELLKKVYENVEDIDFFVGAILERQIINASVGPTFHCVLIEQFLRKKIGDRFWYENGNMSHSFKLDQLNEIRKSTLSRLLCDNGDNITDIQPDAFQFASIAGNDIVPCAQIPSVNLSAWIEIPSSAASTIIVT